MKPVHLSIGILGLASAYVIGTYVHVFMPIQYLIFAAFISCVSEIYYHNCKLKGIANVLIFLFYMVIDVGAFILGWNVLELYRIVINYLIGRVPIANVFVMPFYMSNELRLTIAVIIENLAISNNSEISFFNRKSIYVTLSSIGLASLLFHPEFVYSKDVFLTAFIFAVICELIIRRIRFDIKMLFDVIIDIGAYLVMYGYIVKYVVLGFSQIVEFLTRAPFEPSDFTRRLIFIIPSIIFELFVAIEYMYDDCDRTK